MIFRSDLNSQRNANYESTIKNLEKAKELLEDRYAKKQINDKEYIQKSKEITDQIEKYRKIINNY